MDTVDTRSIKNFLPPELFEKVKKQLLAMNLGPEGPHKYHPVAGRWLEEVRFDEETEAEILEIAKKTFGSETLRRSGFHTGRYQKQNGIVPQLWKHYDQSACFYSLDICIDKNVDWELVVDDVVYEEEPNSCVVFCGNYQMHWRPEYPTEDEDKFVHLLFMQFAEPDHWAFQPNGFTENSWKSDFRFRAKMGYWSMPDYSNDRPICECCDYRHVINFEGQYQKEKDFWEAEVNK